MLADFLRLLLRRWALSLLAIVVALAGAGAALLLVTPIQRSEASVLFVPPNQDATVQGTINPFLALGGSLGVVPSVLQATVTDDRTTQMLLDAGHEGIYTVVVDLAQNAAPILLVSVDSHSAADSVGTMNAVVAQISTQLAALQKARAVDPRYLINYTVLTTTPKPLVVRSGQIQAAALVAIAVLVVGVALIGVVSRAPDRLPGRRRAGSPNQDSGHPPAPSRAGGDTPGPGTTAVAAPPTPEPLPPTDVQRSEPPMRVAARVAPPVPGAVRSPPRRRGQQITRPVRPVASAQEPVGSGRGGSVDARS